MLVINYNRVCLNNTNDDVYEDTWKDKENEWIFYLKNVLTTAFGYARYTKGMEDLTGFGMKNSLTLQSLAIKFFNSSRDENDEPVYSYYDKYMRYFVQKSIKGGRCVAQNHYYESIVFDEVFSIISTELNINGNVYEILDKYFELGK